MNETILKYFRLIKDGVIVSESQMPSVVKKNVDFQNFCKVGIILRNKSGSGYVYQLNEEKQSLFETYFNDTFPQSDIKAIDKASNIAKFKNSKSRQIQTLPIIFIKGQCEVIVNKEIIDLKYFTEKFNLFSAVIQSLETEKICLVENKYLFLEIEKVIFDDYVFIHSYGRIGKTLLNTLNVKHILVVSDYDYVGLNEYLKCKELFSNTKFYIPDNYNSLFETYSRPLKTESKKGQNLTYYPRVEKSTDEIVVHIREQVKRTQRFLEQEILLYECER